MRSGEKMYLFEEYLPLLGGHLILKQSNLKKQLGSNILIEQMIIYEEKNTLKHIQGKIFQVY